MAKTPRKTSKRKPSSTDTENMVGEPQTPYLPKASQRAKSTAQRQKGYDARRYTGMIPGIAARMKEYMKHMRDDRCGGLESQIRTNNIRASGGPRSAAIKEDQRKRGNLRTSSCTEYHSGLTEGVLV
jgi:hypothetical protein